MTEDLRQAEIEYIRHCMNEARACQSDASFRFLLRLRDGTWLVVADLIDDRIEALVYRVVRWVYYPWDECLDATPEGIWAKIDHRRKFPLDGASTAA